jgi:hypothetical protein
MPNLKKIIILLAVVLIVIGILPFAGNRVAEELVSQRVELLNSYGVEAVVATTDSSYLETQKHYEFLIKNEKKFIAYLQQFSDEQLPPYTDALLKGTLLGVDAHYSNLPLSDAIAVDIYPLSFATEIMNDIKKEDASFFLYLQNFLESKGVLYHINYNVVKDSFDGYIKDIQEKYLFDDKTEMKLTLLNANYSGKGPLVAPKSLVSDIDLIELEIAQGSEHLLFKLKGFSSDAIFKTRNTYITRASLGDFSIKVKNLENDIETKIVNLSMQVASDTEGNYAKISAKNTLESFTFSSLAYDINATGFNYDITLSDVDKDTFEELMQLSSPIKGQNSQHLQAKLEHTVLKLFSKGLKIDISDLSLQNIALNKRDDLEGFSLKSTLLLKPDTDFALKVKSSPVLLLSNMDIKLNLKFSKKVFALLKELNPILFMVQKYAKEDAGSLVFDVTFINGEFRVNGKALK